MARGFVRASGENLTVSSGLGVTDYPITMACWSRSDLSFATFTRYIILSWWYSPSGANGNAGLQLSYNSDGSSQVVLRTGRAWNSGIAQSAIISDPTTWHHCVALMHTDGPRQRVYLDGVESSVGFTDTIDGTPDTFSIAQYGDDDSAKMAHAELAEVGVWNVALTQGEIDALALGYSPRLIRPGSLAEYVPLVRDKDKGEVSGLSYTVNGTPTVETHPRKIFAMPEIWVPRVAPATPLTPVKVATIREAINTSVGNQTFIASDLGGLTPKAALFIMSSAITDGTAADDLQICVGAATGASNEWAQTASNPDGVGTSDPTSMFRTDKCIRFNVPGTSSVECAANLVSFGQNGVTINWTDAPGSAYLLTVVLFAGTGLSAHANFVDLGAQDVEVDVTDPGFQPDIVIASATRKNHSNENTSQTQLSVGVAHYDGVSTVAQNCWHQLSRWNVSPSEINGMLRTDRVVDLAGDAGGSNQNVELDNFDSVGFSAYTRINNADCDMGYLALSFGGEVESYVGIYTTPTATGNDAETGPGFQPQFVMLGETLLEALNSNSGSGLGGQVGIGVFDADNEYSTSIRDEDDVATMNNSSLSDNQAIAIMDEAGALDVEATFVSFDPTGFTLNYSNITASPKQFWVLAIGENPTPPTGSFDMWATNRLGFKVIGKNV